MASQPLASIVVRTMGRNTLGRALERIAAQTVRPMEIVLVDASASLAPIARHADIPVTFVRNGQLARAAAANAGLDAARGHVVAFLDEDDEIESQHLADLLAAMAINPGARAAYSQTRLVDAQGNTQRIFGGPFNRMALFRSNYLAIHAVAFERSLAAEGCRFDESLEMFEDWDFWLQLAMRTPFAFTGRPTALYHAAMGSSGAGAGPNLARERVFEQRERLMRKWEGARRALEAVAGRA
jgi:glycosyltransferase involved in cell wall biosynthesis